MNTTLSLIVCLLITVSCYALTVCSEPCDTNRASTCLTRQDLLKSYAEKIRPLDFDYRQVGSVLEALGFLYLQEKHAPNGREVYGDVQYNNHEGRTLGELDLVVWCPSNKQVVAVYEVKISKNYERAMAHAHSQLARFQRHLKNEEINKVSSLIKPARDWQPSDFSSCTNFGVIGGTGSLKYGSTIQLDLERNEADILQGMLLRPSGLSSSN